MIRALCLILALCAPLLASAERISMNFEYDEVALLLENSKFKTVIDFVEEKNIGYIELDNGERFESKHGRKEFHYRYCRYSKQEQLISTGEGELYERYSKINVPFTESYLVRNSGGKLRIDPEGTNLEWSANTGERGFIYFDPGKVKVTVIPEMEFQSVMLQ
jgi:hypothetical protein